MVTLEPKLSAAWIAARKVQDPPLVDTQVVPFDAARAASVESLTVNVAELGRALREELGAALNVEAW